MANPHDISENMESHDLDEDIESYDTFEMEYPVYMENAEEDIDEEPPSGRLSEWPSEARHSASEQIISSGQKNTAAEISGDFNESQQNTKDLEDSLPKTQSKIDYLFRVLSPTI